MSAANRMGDMWDYVRRPEGDPSTMVVPGLTGRSSDEIGAFLAEGHALLRPLGVYQGAAVFGIAATRPQTIAQDIPLIAQHVDYLSPMLYPEKWNRGEYDVADPQAQPYDIIFRSLVDFQIQVAPMADAGFPDLTEQDQVDTVLTAKLEQIVGPPDDPNPDYDHAALTQLQSQEVSMVASDIKCEKDHISRVEDKVRAEYESTFREQNADLLSKVPPP